MTPFASAPELLVYSRITAVHEKLAVVHQEDALKTKFLALIAWVFVVAACGDDESSNQDHIFVPPDTGIDMPDDMGTDIDTGIDMPDDMTPDSDADIATDMDMPPDMTGTTCPEVPCTGTDVCVNGTCVENSSCGTAHDLGQISVGDTVTDSGSFLDEGKDDLSTSCGDVSATRERVVKFEVMERSLLTFDVNWTGQFDGVVSFRTTCEDDETETSCQDEESGAHIFEPGTYFMVLEMKFGNAGTYDVSIYSQAAGCVQGESMCMGSSLATCPTGTTLETATCPAACANNQCTGGTCNDAITVTAPGGTFTGEAGAFGIGHLNFAGNASCGNSQSPGYEVVFYLPGLTSGQVVNVDALTNDANSNVILITSTCGDTEMCVANYAVENIDWVVPSDGDYYVIVDKVLNSRSDFSYAVNIF